MTIRVGTDPEFFLFDTETDSYVSAHNIVPGSKKEPHYFVTDNFGYLSSIQADGTAVEFNIPPQESYQDFASAVADTLKTMRRMFIPRKYKIVLSPQVEYTQHYFDSLPKVAKELGCEPDFNAYTGKTNAISTPKGYPTMRTGAGHIHIGWLDDNNLVKNPLDPDHFNDCRIITMIMDKVWDHLAIEDKKDVRTLLYGAKGAFRPKPYGVEYRVPSNRWLINTGCYASIFSAVKFAIAHAASHELPDNPDNINLSRTVHLDSEVVLLPYRGPYAFTENGLLDMRYILNSHLRS